MNCLLKSTKAKQKSNAAKIKFGVKITCDHKEAMDFDADNRKKYDRYKARMVAYGNMTGPNIDTYYYSII